MDAYEKKYNEALERAQKVTRAGGDVAMEIVQSIFPELRESEDERIRKELVNFILYKAGHLLDEETEHKFIAWLEKQKEQKPAEWSEEDEEMIKMILGDLEWERRNTTVDKDIRHYDKEIAFLKSLRPQSKVELSEDVKKTLDEVSHILIGLNYKQVAEDYKQAVEKLLSLRPSWKPSEEQMSILKAVKDYVGRGSGYWGEGLGSLIEDLEKLM